MCCNLVENIGNSLPLIIREKRLNNHLSFSHSPNLMGSLNVLHCVFPFFLCWTVGSTYKHFVETSRHFHHTHYAYVRESGYHKLPPCWEILLTTGCSHFLDVPTCFIEMVISLLHAQYVRSTLEILYTNSSFPHTTVGIQFLYQCWPTLENKNH